MSHIFDGCPSFTDIPKYTFKETAKLELSINNISSGSCKVKLVLYKDSKKAIKLQDDGETEIANY